MVVTEILWLILVFFVPGIISFVVFRHIAGYAINAIYKLIIYTALFGLIDYAIYEFLIGHILYGFEFGTYLPFWEVLSYRYIKADVGLMFWICVFGFFVGLFSGYIVLQVRKVYRPSLHVKLWDNILHSQKLKGRTVIVTDYENNSIRYKGKVKSFSYFSHYREIVLTGVKKGFDGDEKEYDVYLNLRENKFDIAWDPNENIPSNVEKAASDKM